MPLVCYVCCNASGALKRKFCSVLDMPVCGRPCSCIVGVRLYVAITRPGTGSAWAHAAASRNGVSV